MGQAGLTRPGDQLATRRLQHPFTQWQDEAGVLGHGDELGRRDHAALGMRPTDQGFGTEDAPRGVHLGLIVQSKLLTLKAAAHVGLQRRPAVQGGLHLGVKEAQRVTARLLRLGHGQVGLAHQLVEAERDRRAEQCDADAAAGVVLLPGQVARLR